MRTFDYVVLVWKKSLAIQMIFLDLPVSIELGGLLVS